MGLRTLASTVLLLHNRMAGAKDRLLKVESLVRALEAAGFQIQVCEALEEFEAESHRLFAEQTLFASIAAGGDGTLAEAVNRSPQGSTVVPFPLGTENLVARYFSIMNDTKAFTDLLRNGERISLDAGRANGRLFLLMIGAGFDAEVVRQLSLSRSGHITRYSYAKPLWTSLRSYKYPPIQVYCKGSAKQSCSESDEMSELRFVAKWVLASNLPIYAMGLQLTPKAVANDALLEVGGFENGSFFHGIKYLVSVVTRRQHKLRDVKFHSCTEVRLESVDGSEVPFQLDGDFAGVLPVDVTLEPGRFTTFIPKETMKLLFRAEGTMA